MRCTLTAASDGTVFESLSLTFLSGTQLGASAPFASRRISQSLLTPRDSERNVEFEEPTTVPSSAAVSAKR